MSESWLPHECNFCKQYKRDTKPRSDWTPPMPLCDQFYEKWWNENKDELG